jgi:hypothetical protein
MKLPNINLKDIEFKQFFLQRGEWVGLGVAVLIALPVFYSGAKAFFSSKSPKANAEDISRLAKKIEDQLRSSKAPDELANPPAESELALVDSNIDPSKFPTESPWFVPSRIEDTKRREPVVLAPADFQGEVVRGGYLGNVFLQGSDGKIQVEVLQEKEKLPPRPMPRRLRLLLQQYGQQPGQQTPAPGGFPGGKMGRRDPFFGVPTTTTTTFVSLEQVERDPSVRLAQEMYPLNMILVTGTFPFKEQLEQFRQALHKRSLSEIVQEAGTPEVPWEFRGLIIERREFGPDGKLKSDWQNATDKIMGTAIKILAVVPDKAPVDEYLSQYPGIINPGLVMPLPPLNRGEYPEQLPASLQKTLKDLAEVAKSEFKLPETLFTSKAQGRGINPWDPLNPFGMGDEQREPQQVVKSQNEIRSESEDSADPLLPKDVLVRFYDRDIEPGHGYEYRVKVRMANPNYNMKNKVAYAALAKEKEIESPDWALVPKIQVPYEIEWYVMSDRAGRSLEAQFHRWVESVLTDPVNNRSAPVGEWVIWDKAPVYRGEYLGRVQPAYVPVWSREKEWYELARNNATHSRTVPVDFTVITQHKYDPALLVDYEGGIHNNVSFEKQRLTDEEPVRALVLTSEGKLVVRDSLDDKENEVRKRLYGKYIKELAEAQQGKPAPEKLRTNKQGPPPGGKTPVRPD